MDFELEDDKEAITFEENGVVFVEDASTGDYTIWLAEKPGVIGEIKRAERHDARDILETIAYAVEDID